MVRIVWYLVPGEHIISVDACASEPGSNVLFAGVELYQISHGRVRLAVIPAYNVFYPSKCPKK